MQLLIAASPRFMAITVGALSLYLYLVAKHQRSSRIVSLRLVFASVVLSLLLAIAGIIGLVAIAINNKALERAEFVLEDVVRLGLNLLTAFLFYPRVLAHLIAPVKYTPPTSFIWLIVGLSLAGYTLDIHFLFLNRFQIPSFILSALASCMIIVLLIRITIIRLRCPSRSPSVGWTLLACFQLLALAITAIHLQIPVGILDILNWFFLLVWTTGTMMVFLSMLSVDSEPFPLSPKLQSLHVPRRIPHISVSEDFQACRDPFAGPLGIGQFPTIPGMYPPQQHSLLSFAMKQHDSQGPYPLSPSTSPRKKRPSFQIFSKISSRPTTADTAETTNDPSFHTAEPYLGENSEDETESPQKAMTIQTEKSTSTRWLLSHAALASLPSLPPPAHLPPPPLENKHSRSRLRSIDPPSYTSPSKSEVNLAMTLSLPRQTSRRNISIDRTPTQSLYVSNLSSAAAHTATLASNIEAAEDHLLKPSDANGDFPSIASLPSIPSFMDTPDHTFTSDFETSAETRVDDSIGSESVDDAMVKIVGDDIPDERTLPVEKELPEKPADEAEVLDVVLTENSQNTP